MQRAQGHTCGQGNDHAKWVAYFREDWHAGRVEAEVTCEQEEVAGSEVGQVRRVRQEQKAGKAIRQWEKCGKSLDQAMKSAGIF